MAGNFREDIKKYYRINLNSDKPPIKNKIRMWMFNWGLHCVAVYRFKVFASQERRKHWGYGFFLDLLASLLCIIRSFIHHVEIEAEIGPGFYIGHASNIFIGKCTIGTNFSVTHNVTIGMGQGENDSLPQIGDNVWVGTGAVLFGGIKLDNNVSIMPGSVLSKNVPANCLVGGNPGRIINHDYDNQHMFNKYFYSSSS